MKNPINLIKKEERDFILENQDLIKEEMALRLSLKKPIREVNIGLCVVFFMSGLVSTVFYWFYYGLEMFKEGTAENMTPILFSIIFAFILFSVFLFPILTLKQPDLDYAFELKENSNKFLREKFYTSPVSEETKALFKSSYNISLSNEMTNNHVVNYLMENASEEDKKLINDIINDIG